MSDIFRFDDFFSRAVGAGNFDLGFTLLIEALAALSAHGFQCAYSALVAGSTRFNTLPDPGFFLCQALVEQRVAGFFLFVGLFLELQVVGVVAGPRNDLAAINFNNSGGQAL